MDVAIEDLQSLAKRKAELQSIAERIRVLDGRMGAPKGAALDASPPTGRSYEDRLIDMIAKKDELQCKAKRIQVDVDRVERTLARLPDDQQMILDRFFVHRTRDYVDQLCEALGYERAQVYRDKDRAIRQYTLILYGSIEI